MIDRWSLPLIQGDRLAGFDLDAHDTTLSVRRELGRRERK